MVAQHTKRTFLAQFLALGLHTIMLSNVMNLDAINNSFKFMRVDVKK